MLTFVGASLALGQDDGFREFSNGFDIDKFIDGSINELLSYWMPIRATTTDYLKRGRMLILLRITRRTFELVARPQFNSSILHGTDVGKTLRKEILYAQSVPRSNTAPS